MKKSVATSAAFLLSVFLIKTEAFQICEGNSEENPERWSNDWLSCLMEGALLDRIGER